MSTEAPERPRPPRPRFANTAATRATLRVLKIVGTAGRLILQTLLALIIVFEEWGWRPLAAALARLGRLKPVAWLEAHVQRLPPYGALLVFVMPSILILPLKLLALYLIASGQATAAAMLFIGAKVVGTAIVARLFQLTEQQLLQIPWFAWGYGVVMPWKDALKAWIRDSWAWSYGRVVKERLRRLTRPFTQAVRAEATALMARMRGWRGRT